MAADCAAAPELGNVRIGGHTGILLQRHLHNRIFSEFARNVAYKEAEDAFKNQLDDFGTWQGEFWGKHMLGACGAYRYTQDAKLLAFIRESAKKLISYQREDGYIGTFRDSGNVYYKNEGSNVPYNLHNWNIWCRKYTLWALLECFEVTGDREILSAAERLANHLLSELQEKQIDIADTGHFVMAGMPSCSIMKPILLLYRHTKEKKLLEFAVEIAGKWEREDGRKPNLIQNALSGKGPADWYDAPGAWCKAYEMMSCFEGLIELYRVTGVEKYRTAAERFWESLVENEWNPVCSVGYNDKFGSAADELNAISEPCDAIHFMRLCYELYMLSGKPVYLDRMEKTFFNGFMAGVFNDGKWGARGVRGAGRHFYTTEAAKLHYNHCCVNNMPRAFMTFAQCAVVKQGDCIVVNFYENLAARLDNAEVQVSGSYFTDGKVRVEVDFREEPAEVWLRIPDWCEKATVIAGAEAREAGPGYCRVDCRERHTFIEIQFCMRPQIHPFKKAVPQHPDDDWRIVRFLLKGNAASVPETVLQTEPRATITYGPLLLARSKLVGNTEEEMFFQGAGIAEDAVCELKILDSSDVRLKGELTVTDANGTWKTAVCDFASAGNEKLVDPLFFSLYF